MKFTRFAAATVLVVMVFTLTTVHSLPGGIPNNGNGNGRKREEYWLEEEGPTPMMEELEINCPDDDGQCVDDFFAELDTRERTRGRFLRDLGVNEGNPINSVQCYHWTYYSGTLYRYSGGITKHLYLYPEYYGQGAEFLSTSCYLYTSCPDDRNMGSKLYPGRVYQRVWLVGSSTCNHGAGISCSGAICYSWTS